MISIYKVVSERVGSTCLVHCQSSCHDRSHGGLQNCVRSLGAESSFANASHLFTISQAWALASSGKQALARNEGGERAEICSTHGANCQLKRHSTSHLGKIVSRHLSALYMLHLQLDFFEAHPHGWSNQSAAQSVVKCTVSNPLHAHKRHLDPVLRTQSPHCAVMQQASKPRAIAWHEWITSCGRWPRPVMLYGCHLPSMWTAWLCRGTGSASSRPAST